jgi:hypothetical protein
MQIDQRNAGAAITSQSGFPVDRFGMIRFGTDQLAWSWQQDSSAPTGFVNSLKLTVTTAETSITDTENCNFTQRMEGTNVADLGWGTANAKTVTLSFWVRSSLTGTFGGAIFNSDQSRNYPYSYSISSADTWEYKTVTIPGDTTGTWLTTTSTGIGVNWGLGNGSDRVGTAGAWTSSLHLGVTGQVQLVETLNATWYITGVQLEVGSVATPFERRPYGTELALCERYFWRQNGASNATIGAGHLNSSTDVRTVLRHPTTMRANPTVTFTGSNFSYSEAGAVKSLASLAAADQTPQTVLLYSGAGTASGTQGNGCFWVITNADSFISISAEL